MRFRRRPLHKTMAALYEICSSYISNGANVFLHYNLLDYILSSSWIWYPGYQNVAEIKLRPIYKVQQQVRPRKQHPRNIGVIRKRIALIHGFGFQRIIFLAMNRQHEKTRNLFENIPKK